MRVQSDNKTQGLHESSDDRMINKQSDPKACRQEVDSFEEGSTVAPEYSYLCGDGRLEKNARIQIVVNENHSRIWWDELRDLADSLPVANTSCEDKAQKLDDTTKETLRILARSAPHLRMSI